MNILWITNIPIADIAQKLNNKNGVWMDALLSHLRGNKNNKYTIVTTWNVKTTEKLVVDNVSYYLIPGGYPVHYSRRKEDAKKDWNAIFEAEKPSIIQVWGTEFAHPVTALELARERKIPSVIYIQGIMKAIAKYATGGVDRRTMLRYITLRDIYRRQLWIRQNKWFSKRARTEEKIIGLSNCVIVENKWAEMYFRIKSVI